MIFSCTAYRLKQPYACRLTFVLRAYSMQQAGVLSVRLLVVYFSVRSYAPSIGSTPVPSSICLHRLRDGPSAQQPPPEMMSCGYYRIALTVQPERACHLSTLPTREVAVADEQIRDWICGQICRVQYSSPLPTSHFSTSRQITPSSQL